MNNHELKDQEIKFLNIDLDIVSKEDITIIVEEFGNKVCVHRNELHEGLFHASFETGFWEENKIIKEYYTLITKLSPKARIIWNNCNKRVFDFGYQGGSEPKSFHSQIASNSINLISEVGGSVVITIYPPYEKHKNKA